MLLMIGERTIEICRQMNRSVYSVEKEAGFAKGTIKRWDTHTPSIENVRRVADILECSVDDMLEREPGVDVLKGFMKEMVDKDSLTDDESLLLQSFRTMREETRYKLLREVLALKMSESNENAKEDE